VADVRRRVDPDRDHRDTAEMSTCRTTAMRECRRRLQQETIGHNCSKLDPL
jgi:hypothetical protein